MARMLEPYTGTEFEVNPKNVGKREEAGWILLDGIDEVGEVPYDRPEEDDGDERDEPESEDAGDAVDEDGDEAEVEAGTADDDGEKPNADWTIAEIRSWAKDHGVSIPARANKAQMLDAIG